MSRALGIEIDHIYVYLTFSVDSAILAEWQTYIDNILTERYEGLNDE